MAELIASRSVRLTAQNQRLQSPTVSIGQLTSAITVKLRRPTTSQPLNWSANSTVRVSLVFLVDGIEYRAVGQVSGGIRLDRDGGEIPEYSLTYNPTVLFGDKARAYIKTAIPDQDGFYNDVPLTRLGELGSTVQGYLLLERIRGTINTVITIAATTDAPAPKIRHKNSVAFDAATTGYETSGDGVLSFSHTSSGSDRAVFCGISIVSFTPVITSFNCSYGGSAMSERWDSGFATYYGQAGYTLAGQATGSQTVLSNLDDSTPFEHSCIATSFTGVDSGTPTGTPNTATGSSSTPSVTVAGTVTDGMVVDNVADASSGISSVGANQTQRGTHAGAGGFMSGASSTQSSNDGGVMSWTLNSAVDWSIGAIEFKPVAAGKGFPFKARPMMALLVR